MKNIIFITRALWIGGIERSLVELLWHLKPEKYRITLLLLEDSRQLARELPPWVRLLCLTRRDWPLKGLSGLTEIPTAPSRLHRVLSPMLRLLGWGEAWLFDRWIRHRLREKFNWGILYSDQVARTGIRSIRAENFLLFHHHGVPRRFPGDRAVLQKARRILTPAPLPGIWPEHGQKLGVLRPMLRGDRLPERGEGSEIFTIATVGRLHWDKGPDLAVEAGAILRDRGLEFRWLMAGDGPEMARIRQKIRDLRLSHRFFLLGEDPEPWLQLAGADLYVQPSRVEAYGLSITEAQIIGIPVIATDTPGARAQLPPAALCRPTPQALANAIENFPPPSKPRNWQKENRESLEFFEALLQGKF